MMLAAMLMSFIPAATLTTQTAAAFSTCDWAQFIADVTVPDGTPFSGGGIYQDLAIEEHRQLHVDDGVCAGV